MPKTEADPTVPTPEGWPVFDVWKKYEDIAMHFNDLLIRLRTQALAAVAALTTVIGIFAKASGDPETTWEMVAFAFAFLLAFWFAIWMLDFMYYNRLLTGAVETLINLEKHSKENVYIRHLEISTKIEDVVAAKLKKTPRTRRLNRGRWWYYGSVAFALTGGLAFAVWHALQVS